MTFPLASLFDPALLFGVSGGGGVLAFVGARFHKLEKEVRECRKRDSDMAILSAGVRMMVGELGRELPNSQSLKLFGDMIAKKLGPPPTIEDFADLLRQVDDAAPDYQSPDKRHAG